MITDTALIFEGGGMRASYTAGALVTLLEEGISFADVYGISAGSSHTVNYISKDIERAKDSFIELTSMRGAAGWLSFLRGRGYFHAEFLYEIAAAADGELPFDFEAFKNNPARPHIEAFDRDTGQTVCWDKDDMPTVLDLMRRVRASSTMPLFMPPIKIDGHVFLDGGLGDSWGIPLARAKQDGYKKFFIVRTQTRAYRKKPEKYPMVTRALFGAHPIVVSRMHERYLHYNAILDEIDELTARGEAYAFCPNTMSVKNTTLNRTALMESYEKGYAQARGELSAWRDFL